MRLLHFLFPWDLVLEALLHQQQVGGGAILNEQLAAMRPQTKDMPPMAKGAAWPSL